MVFIGFAVVWIVILTSRSSSGFLEIAVGHPTFLFYLG